MLVGDYINGVVKIRDGWQEAVEFMAKGKKCSHIYLVVGSTSIIFGLQQWLCFIVDQYPFQIGFFVKPANALALLLVTKFLCNPVF